MTSIEIYNHVSASKGTVMTVTHLVRSGKTMCRANKCSPTYTEGARALFATKQKYATHTPLSIDTDMHTIHTVHRAGLHFKARVHLNLTQGYILLFQHNEQTSCHQHQGLKTTSQDVIDEVPMMPSECPSTETCRKTQQASASMRVVILRSLSV